MPAGFPVIEPDTPKSATVTQPAHGALPPNVLLLPNSAAPVSAGQLIDDLGAVRFGRDGKQMDIELPARLRNMLRAPRQEGVIPTGGKAFVTNRLTVTQVNLAGGKRADPVTQVQVRAAAAP